jgi:hypothetical protein
VVLSVKNDERIKILLVKNNLERRINLYDKGNDKKHKDVNIKMKWA